VTILDWYKRRFTKSRGASDDAIEQFARVAKGQDLPLKYDVDKRLADLLSSYTDPAGNLDEIAKLLGQSKP
jgi:hypothetical protein